MASRRPSEEASAVAEHDIGACCLWRRSRAPDVLTVIGEEAVTVAEEEVFARGGACL
jgi:hypothetical protein